MLPDNKQKKKNKRTIQFILIVSFSFLATGLFVLLDSRKSHHQQQYLQRITERYEYAYKTIYSQHKMLANILKSGVIGRFDIEDLYRKLVTADEAQKNRLRQELLTRIKPRYEMFQKTVQLRQLHFHLQNNESFLRLHRPEKFGDNLTGIRKTVEYVNKEHTPIDGFEEGKIFNGYRFVFPIATGDKTHIGSFEMSFGPEALTSGMMEQYAVLCNFFIKKNIVEENVFPDEIKRNYTESPFSDYFFDNKVLAELERVSRKELKELQPCKDAAAEMSANINRKRALSVYDSCTDAIFTTIPVFHPLSENMVAFFAISSKSDFFLNETRQFWMNYFLMLLVIGMTLIVFYIQYSKSRTLETTMTLLQQERDLFMQGSVMTFTWQNSKNWPVEQVSENVLTLLGYSAKEFLDGSVQYAALIHKDDLQQVTDEISSASKAERNNFTHKPYRLISRSGETIWVLDNSIVIRDNEKQITHFHGYLVDITETIRLEEERKAIELTSQRNKKMEAIGLMAGGVAHDLNNILTGITGYPDLLLSKLPAESELRKPIAAIKESGMRAAAVVGDLLTVARGVASTRESYNLNTLVSEYFNSPEGRQIQTLYPQVQFLQLLKEDPLNICCSPVHIKKCIMNLVINGAEAIDTSGSVTVSTETFVPDSQWAQKNGLQQVPYILLTVTDTGTGISNENIDHVFEPFYSKKMMGRSGTCLGLAVVWNSVEDHTGKIFVQSSDKGTTFQLYFPVCEKGADLCRENKNERSITGNGESILVVDDDPQLRKIGSQMLQAIGYRVDSVSSGELAIQFVKEHSVDLIVLDMLMEPGINGYQTYRKIIEMHPEQKAVIVSGFSESDDVKAALKLGASRFVKKPYSMDQLGHAVKNALDGDG